MAISSGSKGLRRDPNIVPLIDVVLVLLIFFMIVLPVTQRGFEVVVPPKARDSGPPPTSQLVVSVDRDGQLFINRDAVAGELLAERLRQLMSGRIDRTVFFASDGEVEYERALAALSLVHESGAQNLGIVFEDLPIL